MKQTIIYTITGAILMAALVIGTEVITDLTTSRDLPTKENATSLRTLRLTTSTLTNVTFRLEDKYLDAEGAGIWNYCYAANATTPENTTHNHTERLSGCLPVPEHTKLSDITTNLTRMAQEKFNQLTTSTIHYTED